MHPFCPRTGIRLESPPGNVVGIACYPLLHLSLPVDSHSTPWLDPVDYNIHTRHVHRYGQGKVDEADARYLLAIEIAEKAEDHLVLAKILNNRAFLLRKQVWKMESFRVRVRPTQGYHARPQMRILGEWTRYRQMDILLELSCQL